MKKRIVQVGDISCGADQLFLISGPCVIEEERIMLKTADVLKQVSEKLDLPVIYKSSFQKDNRSTAQNYRGPGLDKGIELLCRIKQEFNFPILSDVHYPQQVAQAAEFLDVIQIPAYLCMQTDLLEAVARTGKVINIKHGQFLAPENMVKPVQKAIDSGNEQIILTERGYSFGYNDLIVDPRSFFYLNKIGFPVVFDITHSVRRYGIPSADPKGGSKEFLPVLSRSGVAAGVDGIFIETHPEPQKALCDASSQLSVFDLEEFLKPLLEIHEIEVRYRNP